ncbi:MAG: hypothetical protein JNM22_10230 [Saprospiraceae bacterium]|nr:hypothetical protein [Saprospiraceae bacterium]
MSINPFERKFREFAQSLSKKNAEGNADVVASKSGEVFKDKPFTEEYAGVYKITQVGQSVAQVVTFLTTAALGVFALTHIVPLSWGIYIAIPLGLLFAFGVENVKRSTLAIAAKHFLKYKQFGFVGVAALLVMCVSIAAALYGAKELPGVVYPKPARAVDGASVVALTADIDRVQKDIDQVQSNLKTGKNWIAENRTLPKLQTQRAELVEKREAATKDAAGRGDTDHLEALADRQEKIDKMQVYAVGAAIVAELIFLLCTAFILYYLFRHYAEGNHEESEQDAAQAPGVQITTTTPGALNGKPVASNLRADNNSVRYTMPAPFTRTRADDFRSTDTTIIVDDNRRICEHCKTPYQYRHSKQKFCSDSCRIASWETQSGKKLKRTKISA